MNETQKPQPRPQVFAIRAQIVQLGQEKAELEARIATIQPAP